MKNLIKNVVLATLLLGIVIADGATVGTLLSGSFNVVTTEAALKAFPVAGMTSAVTVEETGYLVAGDMPPVTYSLSPSACADNAGAGDDGDQVPSNTAGYCWVMQPRSVYDVRWWKAIPGGADPNGTNARQLNYAFAYVGAVSVAGRVAHTDAQADLDGGGLQYGTSGPVIDAATVLHVSNLAIMPLSATNFPCGTSGALEETATADQYFERVQIDLNYLPVTGFYDLANGTNRFDESTIFHWLGSCASTNTVGTVTAGSNVVADSNTSVLATGMIFHGQTANGIPDLSVITQITPNVSFVINQAATASASNATLTASTDPNGVSLGAGGNNTGGTFGGMNVAQFKSSDADSTINADRSGFDFAFYSGANDVSVSRSVTFSAVSNYYVDSGAGTIKLDNDEIGNSSWTGTEVNPADVIQADGGGKLQITSPALNGGIIQAFIADSAGENPSIQVTNPSFTTSGNVSLPASALVVVYNNQTGANAGNVLVDPLAATLSNGALKPVLTTGPGTFATAPNTFSFGAVGSLELPTLILDSKVKLNNQWENAQAPSIASGFGTGASVLDNSGTAAFSVGVGTGGTASSGTLTFIAATHFWSCTATDRTSHSAGIFQQYVIPVGSNSVSVTNYSDTGVATPWNAGDILDFQCGGH